jgi:hypothetical protein
MTQDITPDQPEIQVTGELTPESCPPSLAPIRQSARKKIIQLPQDLSQHRLIPKDPLFQMAQLITPALVVQS